jgi:hypothetical protein
LPPKPPEELDDDAPPMPLPPELEDDPPTPLPLLDDDVEPALPREPADVEPALRLAVLDALLVTDEMLLPAEELLTSPATDADLAVAALTCVEAFEADLFVAATPPPVPAA